MQNRGAEARPPPLDTVNEAKARTETNVSISVVKNGHRLLDIQEILTIFGNDSQFMHQVRVEMNGVPSIVAAIFRLTALALTGVVKLIDDAPRKLHRLSTATNAVDQTRIFNGGIDFDDQWMHSTVVWCRIELQRHWIIGALFGPFNSQIHRD